MEYTVQKLAHLAGVSARTIRFYDEIGLLKPARVSASGYRIYGENEVDALQQILFFRALGLELATIIDVMRDASFNRLETLKSHLNALHGKRTQLDLLIDTVSKTIQKEEGEIIMTDKEKFEGLKQRLVDENEQKYGKEVREKYGDKTADESNAKMLKMSKDQYTAMQDMGKVIIERLEAAVRENVSPSDEEGKNIARLHRQWLTFTWPEYTKEAHLGLVDMYLADERFTAHYDGNVKGCARFLHDAVGVWIDSL